MWVIKGSVRYSAYGDEEVNIATFDNYNDAKNYIKAAELKSPNQVYGNKYRRRSLLSSYNRVWVDEYETEELPHNPKIDWK